MAGVEQYGAPRERLRPLQVPMQRQVLSEQDLAPHARDLAIIGQATGHAAGVMIRQQQRMADREDADAVFRATVALRTEALEFEQQTRRERQGAYAKGATTDFESWHSEAASKQVESLTNDRQRQLFQEASFRVFESGKSSFSRFEEAELDKSLTESWQANKVALAREAIADPTPEKARAAEEAIRRQNTFMAAQRGHTAEWLQTENTNDLSTMHLNAIQGIADKDAAGAKAYYESFKDSIAPEKRASVEKNLNTAGLLESTQQRADEIMTKGLPRADTMAYIEKNFSGEEEKYLKQEVDSRLAVAKAARDEGHQMAYEEGTLLVTKGQRVPPSLFAKMTDMQQAHVINTQRAMAEKRKADAAGKPIATDPKLYSKLRRMATDQPGEFGKLQLEQFVDKLSSKDFETLQDRRDTVLKEMKAGSDKKPEKMEYLRQWSSDVNQRAAVMGIKEEDEATFAIEADRALREAEARKGGQLDDNERTTLLDKLVMSGKVKSDSMLNFFGVLDSKKKFFEIRNTAKRGDFVPTVPDDEREKISAALKRAGRPVTDETIGAIFRKRYGF